MGKLHSMYVRITILALALFLPLTEVSARTLPRVTIIPREMWGADERLRISNHPSTRGELGTGHSSATEEEGEIHADETEKTDAPERVRWCSLRQVHYPDEFRVKETVKTDAEGNPLAWPLQYSSTVDLIVIHHTAESLASVTGRTGEERMRALYESHAKGRGWGDIGYHFVIDDEGRIYEGRAGGPNVVGGHTYCNNVGTISVALMGDYTKQRPTPAQIKSLRLLVATLLEIYNLDPTESVVFHGRSLPRIVGHEDLTNTSCPGPYISELLPQLRLFAVTRDFGLPVYSSVLPESTQDVAHIPSPPSLTLTAGESRNVIYRIRNTSKETWNADTWLLGKGNGAVTFSTLHPGGFVAGILLSKSPVPPGKFAAFRVDLQAGFTPGTFRFSFIPVISNARRSIADVFTQNITIRPVALTYSVLSSSFPDHIEEGEDFIGTVMMENTGSTPWTSSPPRAVMFQASTEENLTSPSISLLSSPGEVLPGETGTFTLNLQRLTEGNHHIALLPILSDGTVLHGSPIEIRSTVVASHIPKQREAEEQIVSRPPPKRAEPLQYGRGQLIREQQWDQYLIEGDDADMQLRVSPVYDLYRREQVQIEATIRSKGRGIANLDPLFSVQRDSNAIVLLDENNRRVGGTLLSPFSLQPFDAKRTSFTLIPPGRPGDYELRIGNRAISIHVREDLRRPRFRRTGALDDTPGQSTVASSASERRLDRATRRQLAHATERAVVHASPPPSTPSSTIRIRLSFAEPTAIVQVSSRASVNADGVSRDLPGPVRLSRDKDLCTADIDGQHLSGETVRIEGAGYAVTTILNSPSPQNRPGTTGGTGRSYRGVIECRVVDGELVLINEVPLEEYLWGLAEEPDTEPWQKQRAFAIAARSYALYYMISRERKFPFKPYDGDDSAERFQLYGGVAFEEKNPQWVKAVKNTEGKIISFNGEVIKPPYFSSDDGRTRSPHEAGWGEWPNAPYLASKSDPWCQGMELRGHGVGMSGCGAEAQANQGKSAEEILQYYYPGTTIKLLSEL